MPDEKIIQINTSVHADNLKFITALTNQGRMFAKQNLYAEWEEIDLPPLNKTKPRSQAKAEGYSEGFERLWDMYGKQGNKKAAYRQYEARNKEGDYQQIGTGIIAYNKFIESTGQYKKNFETFIGRDKHYLNDYTIPDSIKKQNRVKQEWETIPENENTWVDWAKKHGFKLDRMDTVFDSRRKLQTQIKQRIDNE